MDKDFEALMNNVEEAFGERSAKKSKGGATPSEKSDSLD
jgi:hypothetical protein